MDDIIDEGNGHHPERMDEVLRWSDLYKFVPNNIIKVLLHPDILFAYTAFIEYHKHGVIRLPKVVVPNLADTRFDHFKHIVFDDITQPIMTGTDLLGKRFFSFKLRFTPDQDYIIKDFTECSLVVIFSQQYTGPVRNWDASFRKDPRSTDNLDLDTFLETYGPLWDFCNMEKVVQGLNPYYKLDISKHNTD